jgi:hypothetical protein
MNVLLQHLKTETKVLLAREGELLERELPMQEGQGLPSG